ncbi:Malto-oligosyltrehalose trehalohydrolase [Fulvivirga imtechensis AK7]|uniref:Malto-oligosyltrehalose trehalohydrolase n=1 Tax=Fulvivirga imtechensis AK7 TaxID=1237149 RepID=L8JXY6_9BACT|nr:malto-oligosyltrehalose trehalohydrolase [Fulvivirga imtechensis]ELR73640.1 Malto-oligosyltrehalose trehalohydrolase [Fulvivirga imtechensis AK7]
MIRRVGAKISADNTCDFIVWAPFPEKVQLEIQGWKRAVDMNSDQYGYWFATLENITPGTRYKFILDGQLRRPDPASRCQPCGVHEWSEVVASHDFGWNDSEWQNIALSEMIIYELHIGTFTAEGTFTAAIDKLDHLLALGVNTIEIMPISQFPGSRNWGYDGVYPYAAQYSYGGPEGLKSLVDVCHQKGIAVILDVVYNHMGPEGNYLSDFGPFFTDKYTTPWGKAINFDDPYSDHVRSFFLQNALMWLDEFHIDGLRLDAIHAILDNSARHFLKELRQNVDELQLKTLRRHYLIAESDMNDVKIIQPYNNGGYNLDAQWVDDFHHAVHTLATGENDGYYSDYGSVADLAKAFRQAFVYDGAFSLFRKRTIGNSPAGQRSEQFVACIQNHDQVGNRMLGERLSQLVSFEMQKLAAGVMLIAPFVPMLFMGEEYGEDHPFLYFVSHGDPNLVAAVRKGRKREFRYFKWKGSVPDPQAEETYNQSKLQWNYHENERQTRLLNYYRQLINLRKNGAFGLFKNTGIKTDIDEKNKLLVIYSGGSKDQKQLGAVLNFSKKKHRVKLAKRDQQWCKIMASSDQCWAGPADAKEIIKNEDVMVYPESFVLYKK